MRGDVREEGGRGRGAEVEEVVGGWGGGGGGDSEDGEDQGEAFLDRRTHFADVGTTGHDGKEAKRARKCARACRKWTWRRDVRLKSWTGEVRFLDVHGTKLILHVFSFHLSHP